MTEKPAISLYGIPLHRALFLSLSIPHHLTTQMGSRKTRLSCFMMLNDGAKCLHIFMWINKKLRARCDLVKTPSKSFRKLSGYYNWYHNSLKQEGRVDV